MANRQKRARKGSTQLEPDNNDVIRADAENMGSAENTNTPSKTQSTRPSGTRRTSSKRQKTSAEPEEAAASADNSDTTAPALNASIPHPRTHAYGTRATNQFRRPGHDVGINWEDTRKEKEAADAARADKKAQDELKKKKAIADGQREGEGIQRLASLELAREHEDCEEVRSLGLTGTARGYLAASSKAGVAQHPRHDTHKSKHGSGSGSEYEHDPAVSSSDSDSGGEDEGSVRDEDDVFAPRAPNPNKKKPKTAAEKKHEKQKQVRGRIDTARKALPKKTGGNAAPANRSQATSAASASDRDGDDAFRPTYRARLQQRDSPRTPTPISDRPDRHQRASKNSAAPSPQLRFRLTGAAPSSDPASPLRRAATPIQNDDETRGLDDADVMISRETAVTRPRGRQNLALQVVYSEPEPPKKPKAKRTAQADMDPKLSRAGKNVPAWISDDFDNVILPTVLDHYGGQEDPWTLDTKKPTKGKAVVASSSTSASNVDQGGLVDVLQQLINQLFPRKHYELASSDIIVRVTRQRIMNWRRAFLDRAINVAATAYQNFKTEHPNASKRDVANWAEGAMDLKTGFALWEVPPTDKDPKPHGGLRSPCVLQTFGPHFKSICGSILADSPPPIGALSLALAALDVAFQCYESGELAPPQSNFDVALGGVATDDYLRLAVAPCLETPDRWEQVMDMAKEYASRGKGSSKARTPRRRRRSEVMPGSSPVRSEPV
ncbi:hypothetical protein LXA43DRAFT_1100679 [Ganoderma leucocontextum]|nr:hypothetical protein LXA43DRAFT_1100679 [Ganoderma leucocontextum]